jgi:hypothetical protein
MPTRLMMMWICRRMSVGIPQVMTPASIGCSRFV